MDLEINSAELEKIKVWIYIYILMRESISSPSKNEIQNNDIQKVGILVFDQMNWRKDQEYLDIFTAKLNDCVRIVTFDNRFLSKINELTESFLKETDQEYLTHFNKDEDFKKSLVTHVNLLVERLIDNKTYANYLTNEIAFKYPTMFSIALNYTRKIEEVFGVTINPGESAFIATYFAVHMEKEGNDKLNQFNRIGVVCGSGGGSAMFIKTKIETFFPNATVKTFSTVEVLNLEEFKPNLIFTIKDLEYYEKIPIIKISELVEDVQLLKIQNYLKNIDTNIMISENDVFYGLLNKKLWKQVKGPIEYETLIAQMADELMNLGYAEKNYKNSILERESYVSTVYLNGVAMPHPMQMIANRNVISVSLIEGECTNAYGAEVKLIFMMCLNQTGYEVLKDITKELYNLMHDRIQVSKLENTKTYEEFITTLRRESDGFINRVM